ncbi:MAG: DNA alkylation repair protein [Anaerolineae bacterium]
MIAELAHPSTGSEIYPIPEVVDLLEAACSRLRREANAEIAARARRFFPENPPILGTPSGLSRAVGRDLARQVWLTAGLPGIVFVAGQLYASGYMEEGACANALLEKYQRHFHLTDWPLFDRWLADFTCWGTTDSFCLKVAAHVVYREGPPPEWLWRWVHDDLIWRRRAALVCLVREVRVGRSLPLAFSLSDALLADSHDLVLKAIGWLLKEACKGDPAAVQDYLEQRDGHLPRLIVRYAREGL